MQRLFIETPTFQRNWQQLGMSDNDLRELQFMTENQKGKAGGSE